MAIEWTRPIWLLAFLLVLAFLIWSSRKLAPSAQKKAQIFLRSAVCLLVVLALAGTQLRIFSGATTMVFAVDVSDSAKLARTEAEGFLQEAFGSEEANREQGVLTFANGTKIVVKPGEEKEMQLEQGLDGSGTQIGQAIQAASTLFPSHGKKHMVLLTDGVETGGDALSVARQMQSQGVTVDGYFLDGVPEEEVQLTALQTPDYVDGNTAFSVEAEIYSTTNTTATLRIYKGSQLLVQEEVQLSVGNNRFPFQDQGDGQSALLYRAEVESKADTWYQNNQAYAYTYVEDVPRVLLVDNGEGSSREMEKLLQQSGLQTNVLPAAQLPTTLEGLSVYDGIVLSNVSANALSSGFLSALEQFVKTAGNGLLVTGGDQSYALGGYQNTLLSTLLPVEMQLKTQGEQPDLAMVMVIDHSGSMMGDGSGVSPMGMAKEAAIRAVEELNDTDTAGVLAFDSFSTWVVEPALVGENRQDMIEKIKTIQPAGGTSILPALQEAYGVLSKVEARKKHIILLTDGQAEQSGYEGVISQMNQSKITLSTVAVGGGADVRLLRSLAEKADGRYYYTDAFSDLPEIFATETVLAGQDYIKTGTFFPVSSGSDTLLSGIDALPALDGYVGTTAKSLADVVLESETGEPVLAQWQYGLGKVLAWTSDTNGLWSSQYLASAEGQSLLRNMISAIVQSNVGKDTTFSGRTEGGVGILQAAMAYDETVQAVSGVAVNSDNEEIPLDFTAVEPGVYEASSSQLTEGSYLVQLQMEKKDGTTEHIRGGVYFSYSPEYDVTKLLEGEAALRQLVSATGGEMITRWEDALRDDGRQAYEQKDLTNLLLVLALLLFLLDIAFRRFPALGLWLERAATTVKRRGEALSASFHTKTERPSSQTSQPTLSEDGANGQQVPPVGPKAEKRSKAKKESIPEEKIPASTMDVLMAKKKKRNQP